MIVNCGKRRLISYRYGWQIQREYLVNKKDGTEKLEWREDRPAWPPNLAQGFAMIAERELKDMGEMDITDIPIACQLATEKIHKYFADINVNTQILKIK